MGESDKISNMRKRPNEIRSKPASDLYRENYDRIFKKEKKDG